MTDTTPELLVAGDPHAAAAGLLADALERTAAERGRVRLAVPGGSVIDSLTQAAALLHARGFDFDRLLLTWVDERCVPLASPDSNRGLVHLAPPPGVVLPLYLDDERPSDAVDRVERALTETFDGALDVLLLGMGWDGHIASLFVGRDPFEGLAAHIADSPKPPPDRITLTLDLLRTAPRSILVATGEKKRAPLERLMGGDPSLPATGLPGLVVCTDLELEGPR